MRIEQALKIEGSKIVNVRGFLLGYPEEPLRLCSELLESFPPQCGGPSLIVRGLNVESLPGITRGDDCVWSTDPVELEGVLEDGVLTID